MSSVKFRLSNNQRKNLLVRGQPLRIALPYPWDRQDDLLGWSRRVLDEDGGLIQSATHDLVWVTHPVGTGLASLMGAICHGQPFHDQLTWPIAAVVCLLQPPHPISVRHAPAKVQWPGFAFAGDHRWPRLDSANPAR